MRQRGFNLIELMIVIAIIGIIAAVAYPSYQNQVESGRLTDAHSILTSTAQRLERCYTANTSYSNCENLENGATVASNSDFYTVTVAIENNGNRFTLTAERIKAQSQNNCGNLTLNNSGVRGALGGTGADVVKACW